MQALLDEGSDDFRVLLDGIFQRVDEGILELLEQRIDTRLEGDEVD